jgi:hypothetical protein
MEQATAMDYLRNFCVVPDAGDPALLQQWEEARLRLGAPMAQAGAPNVSDIPTEHRPYLEGVIRNPRFADTVGTLPWSFQLVEVDRLLAYQAHVITRPATTTVTGGGPTVDEMLARCLPHALENVPYEIVSRPDGFAIRSPDLNLRMFHFGGPLAHNPIQQLILAGLAFGVASPLVQVVRLDGRCYLKNGFHRAYELRRAGADQIPCILLEGNDWSQVVPPGPGAFGRDLRAFLESEDPPTCGHFTQERAYPVTLKEAIRVIDVRVSESAALIVP